MLKRTVFFTRIILAIPLILAGAYLIFCGYGLWQDYFTYDFGLEIVFQDLSGAIVFFFVGVLLLIEDRYYEAISIRRTSFVFGIMIAIASGISFFISSWGWVSYFSGGKYPWYALAPESLLLAIFLSLVSLVFFLRVCQGGGIIRKHVVQTT